MAIPTNSDAHIVRLARKMKRLQEELTDAISEIIQSGHPNADEMADDLYAQCWFAAWPTHVISDYLENPERWETGDYGIRLKGKDRE